MAVHVGQKGNYIHVFSNLRDLQAICGKRGISSWPKRDFEGAIAALAAIGHEHKMTHAKTRGGVTFRPHPTAGCTKGDIRKFYKEASDHLDGMLKPKAS